MERGVFNSSILFLPSLVDARRSRLASDVFFIPALAAWRQGWQQEAENGWCVNAPRIHRLFWPARWHHSSPGPLPNHRHLTPPGPALPWLRMSLRPCVVWAGDGPITNCKAILYYYSRPNCIIKQGKAYATALYPLKCASRKVLSVIQPGWIWEFYPLFSALIDLSIIEPSS